MIDNARQVGGRIVRSRNWRISMNNPVSVRPVQPSDSAAWEQMRQKLWPAAGGEHAVEIARFFDGVRANPAEVLLAVDEAGQPVGFAELSIRPYAEGCKSGRVAYLEGWFVDAAARGTGIGRALVLAAETWGREQDCIELASDTEIENAASAAAHRALGFTETGRTICYKKSLLPRERGEI